MPSFSKMIGSSLSQSFLSWFQENRGLSGHFASLVVSRKSASQRRFAAYRGTSLRSCFLGFRTPLFLFSPFPPFFFLFLFSFFFFLFLFFFFFFFFFFFKKKFLLPMGILFFFFSKKCLLPMGILIFFSKIPPILEV